MKFDPGFMWFRPGMCVVRCNHKHLDYTFVCNNIFGKTLSPASTLPNAVLSGNDMVCSAYLATFIQTETSPFRSPEGTHSCSTQALSLPSLSLSLSLSTHTFFIYLSPSLLSNRAAKWSTAAVSQPAAVLTRDGRTDAFRLQTWWGTGAIQVWKPLLSVKVRSQRSDAQCDLDQQFFWTLLSLRITHCRHLTCCDTELFHSFTLSHFFFTPLLSSCFWSMRHINHFLECSHSQGGSELLWSES